MPHIFTDYSANIENLDEIKLLTDLNQAIFTTGLFKNANDIKSRIQKQQSFVVGFGDQEQAFIHVKLFILLGRIEEDKQKLVKIILETLQKFTGSYSGKIQIQLCAELNEIGTYGKSVKLVD